MFYDELLWVCQRLDQRRFIANHDGNVSIKIDENSFLVTPTARGKAELLAQDLLVIDSSGKTISGTGKVFSEWALHQAIYQNQSAANCVVHAHPPYLTSLGIQEEPLLIDFIPESIVSLGNEIPCLPWSEPQSELQMKLVGEVVSHCVAFLIPGNGVFSFGQDLKTTYYRIELAEHVALITHLLTKKDRARKIAGPLRKSLLEKHRSLGSKPKAVPTLPEEDFMDELVEKVARALEGHV